MPDRPKYLNLVQIRLPIPGVISIMHRVSGAVLFFAVPLLLYWLQQSLASPETFAALQAMFASVFVKIIIIALLWGYLHHLCAGVRHLLLDLDIGTDLAGARAGAVLVLVVSIAATIILGALIW
jgi:succinate dehydrogenase / fumarate reductase cytochrome b subunit